MNDRTFWTGLFFALTWWCLVSYSDAFGRVSGSASQEMKEKSDALGYLASSFPYTVSLKQKGHLIEFCPDNTCDGFVSSSGVPVTTLKDFAYLYAYFFSQYTYLADWRNRVEAKNTAESVLSRPDYRDCRRDSSRETARCVLLDLSRDGKIKLLFIRYDEGKRNVVHEDIVKELRETATSHE